MTNINIGCKICKKRFIENGTNKMKEAMKLHLENEHKEMAQEQKRQSDAHFDEEEKLRAKYPNRLIESYFEL